MSPDKVLLEYGLLGLIVLVLSGVIAVLYKALMKFKETAESSTSTLSVLAQQQLKTQVAIEDMTKEIKTAVEVNIAQFKAHQEHQVKVLEILKDSLARVRK